MHSRPIVSALVLIFSLGIATASEEGATTADPPVQLTPSTRISRDVFSGKTVTDKKMAMAMMTLRQSNAPRVGEKAPAFELFSLSQNRHVNSRELYQDKPVVLIFASWGCDVFREAIGGLLGIHTIYHDKANFVMVYTREVHALDGFGGDLGRVSDPKSDLERRQVAKRCQDQMRLPFEMLVDSIDDPVSTRWAGMPSRIFVMDAKGYVIYAGAHGPWGYKPYRGFVHGDGSRNGWDHQFNEESLEEFLEKRFLEDPK